MPSKLLMLIPIGALFLLPFAHAQVDTEGGPSLVRKVDPQYTDAAREARIEGTVLVRAEIGTDGRAHDIRVARSLGYRLDEKAVAALAQWEFRPRLRRGNPVAAAATIEINFRLPDR